MSLFKDDFISALKISLSKGKGQNSSDSEVSLQKEGLTDASEPSLSKENDMKTTETKTRQREDWATNALSLFKEDMSLFKEDLGLFKDDLTKVFKLSLAMGKDARITGSETSRSREKEGKATNALSLFKEDLSSVFKIGLSKEKDEMASAPTTGYFKDNFTNVFDIKLLSNERGEMSTCSRMRLSKPPEMRLTKDDLVDALKIHHSMEKTKRPASSDTEQTEQRTAASDIVGLSKEDWTDVLKLGFSKNKESKTAYSTSESEVCTGSGDCSVVLREDLKMEKREAEENHSFMSLPWEMTVSRLSLSAEKDSHNEVMSGQSGGEFWTVKSYACYLTLDPNTANQAILLSDDKRKATRVWMEHLYPDHPERFKSCPQVLCREGLLERFYWEVEWNRGADIGVTYNNISRDGDDVNSCFLGHNYKSWSLECSEGSYTPCHNNRRSKSSSPTPFSQRVGVYLDWAGGTLSFYSVSPDTMTHLHTFHTTFTEPLYPGFWVWDYDASVSLCQVELEWERLLQ